MLYLILGFALLLRLISLNQSLWLDEAILANAVSQLSLKDLLTKFMPTDFNPPLFYLIEWLWGRVFGFSEIALRLPSVIFGVLTVYFTFLLSRVRKTKMVWLAPMLLATSGLHLYYSQEARMYSLAAMAVVASFYFLRQKRWLLYTLFTLAAIYSHYLTVLILPAQLLLVPKESVKKLLASWLAVLVGLSPWLPVFATQLKAGFQASGTVWSSLGVLSFKALVLIPVKFLIGRISFESPLVYGLVVIPGLVAWLWVGVAGWRQSKELKWWLAIPLLLTFVLSIKLSILTYFRFLFLLPAVYLWLASGVSSLPKWLRPALASFLVGFNLLTAVIYLAYPRFHREDWRGLVRFLGASNFQHEPVWIAPQVAAPLKYYYAGPVNEESGDILWYIPYAQPIFDPQNLTEKQLLLNGWQPMRSETFGGDLTLIKYRRL